MSALSPGRPLEPAADRVLTTAVLRVQRRLDLTHQALARTIGVSPATVSRMARGSTTVAPESKEGELSILLVRLFRSLDALVGGRDEAVRNWFRAHNHHLGGTPAELVQRVEGLVHVLGYLDAMRGKV